MHQPNRAVYLFHMHTYVELLLGFDKAITQLRFLISVYVQPKAFGIYDTKGSKALSTFGRLLVDSGIHDQFSIPLQKPGKKVFVVSPG